MKRIAIIGGGPSGLRAAECAAGGAADVTLFDRKPSVGRKFLVAGRGGLNLTHSEPLDMFCKRYSPCCGDLDFWKSLLSFFTPQALRDWALGLGSETFVAGSGRVYLKNQKAAGLLRSWVARLKTLGVRFAVNHRLVSMTPGDPLQLTFSNGAATTADAVILAMGGGSWPRTGSDGEWIRFFESLGISTAPLGAANCGWECDWNSNFLNLAEGKPLKNITAHANGQTVAGEVMVTRYGLEGGPIYALGRTLRSMVAPTIRIDLKPAHTEEQLVAKMESVRRNFVAEARQRWKLPDAAYALLARREWSDVRALAHEAKNCTIPLKGPRPLAEAISSAGGVRWEEIDDDLMLKKVPGVFVAGEMIDWEAPTGGYLLQGCFATGSRAAASALNWINRSGDRR